MRKSVLVWIVLLAGSLGAPWAALAQQSAGVPGGAPASALETNADILVRLARDCTDSVVGSTDSLLFSPPARLPFLRSGLVTRWQEQGRQVYAAGSRTGMDVLSLGLESAGVRYARQRGGVLKRIVQLSLSVQLTASDGRIRHDRNCTGSSEDEIRMDQVEQVEEATYPETKAQVPLSFWRRIAHPAVVATATAAGTVLFFSLRSRRSSDG